MRFASFALYLACILCTNALKSTPLTPDDFGPSHKRHLILPFLSKQFASPPTPSPSASTPFIYPAAFGADPTGKKDSTSAFTAAIAAALKHGANKSLADGIHDLGGVTIHLEGGDYLISSPVVIPAFYGNLQITSGTLRASSSWVSKTRYLLEIGTDDSKICYFHQGSCNENIGISHMMFDAASRAAGGIVINKIMGGVVGPQVFILGQVIAGITINGGHEVMIQETWIAQYLWSDKRRVNATSTGIQLFGNDHYITDTIVFSAKIGVEVTHPANVLTGVHTWNLGTAYGGIGILIETYQTRLVNCYLDGNHLVLVNPRHILVHDTFFLSGTLVLQAKGNFQIEGVDIRGGQYNGGNEQAIIVDERAGKFVSMKNSVINPEGTGVDNPSRYSTTRFKASLKQSQQTRWDFDFSSVLPFASLGIARMEYSVAILANPNNPVQFVNHVGMINPAKNRSVSVRTSTPVDALVTVSVDVSTH